MTEENKDLNKVPSEIIYKLKHGTIRYSVDGVFKDTNVIHIKPPTMKQIEYYDRFVIGIYTSGIISYSIILQMLKSGKLIRFENGEAIEDSILDDITINDCNALCFEVYTNFMKDPKLKT